MYKIKEAVYTEPNWCSGCGSPQNPIYTLEDVSLHIELMNDYGLHEIKICGECILRGLNDYMEAIMVMYGYNTSNDVEVWIDEVEIDD